MVCANTVNWKNLEARVIGETTLRPDTGRICTLLFVSLPVVALVAQKNVEVGALVETAHAAGDHVGPARIPVVHALLGVESRHRLIVPAPSSTR